MEPPGTPTIIAWEGSASSRSGGRTGDDQYGFRLTGLAAPIEALHAITDTPYVVRHPTDASSQ
ncbi:unnamed protein product [Clonostachys rhizophaga]|uniref:Uncharacterized protein n=1 Tax=Clonostachys rhizophaga TaxID=160324 RepID=A0A9N9V9P7_9HYPO|nr:unnamed protein product [Clonostachys rhizophaga]